MTVVEQVCVHAVSVVVGATCLLWKTLEFSVCIAWATLKEVVCIAVAGFAAAVNWIAGIFSGPSRIHFSEQDRPVPGNRRDYTDSRSFASLIDYSRLEDRFFLRDGGKYLQFRLAGGRAEWAGGYPPPQFVPFAPPDAVYNSPPNPAGRELSVSYANSRRGQWRLGDDVPGFDLIAASSDRIFAKAADTDTFYIALPGPLYLHRSQAGDRLVLPQSLFQLDPELGLASGNLADLLFHLSVPDDDETHLATERFPTFRSVYRLLESPLRTIESVRTALEALDVQVHPLVWVRLEARPSRQTADPPAAFPSYIHVIYRKDRLLGPPADTPKRSILFDRVLDIGVGLSHLYEQYEPIYGGEMDNLDVRMGPLRAASLYRLANGPIEDVGGYVDGTCIYYLLVRLPLLSRDRASALESAETEKPAPEIENHLYRGRYAVLWLDEQTAFTERWRALDFTDREFLSPFKPIVAVAPSAPWQFRSDRYLDPFRSGFIRPFSRMAVARQVILINGYDKPSPGVPGRHRLYSIHFSWPTADRTWRVRDLPPGAVPVLRPTGASETSLPELAEAAGTIVLPQTVRIREDMTIHVRGTLRLHGKVLIGRWVQKYLPPDNQEVPSAQALDSGTEEERRRSYDHPWQFYAEEAFLRMHQAYSHFGVYQDVVSRCQFYPVKILSDTPARLLEETVWQAPPPALTVDRLELNWMRLAQILDAALYVIPATALISLAVGIVSRPLGLAVFLLMILAELGFTLWHVLDYKTFTSLHENILRFRLRHTPGGWCMFFADKREDKTVGFRHLPRDVTLSDDSGERSVTVRVHHQVRSKRSILERGLVTPPEITAAEVVATVDPEGLLRHVRIRFTSARSPSLFPAGPVPPEQQFEDWMRLNVERVCLGMPDPVDPNRILLDVQRAQAFERIPGTSTFEFLWLPDPAHPRYAELVDLLSESGQIMRGTSLWFVGITGMAGIAGKTSFATVVE